jgi:hypothetical protein
MAPMPGGIRFHGEDEQIIDYLKVNFVVRTRRSMTFFYEVDICECVPWDLPLICYL